MAHQPPFTDEQTNQEAVGNTASSACAQTVPMTCFALFNNNVNSKRFATFSRARHRRATTHSIRITGLPLRDGVESRYPEDASLGHRDECRLQRIAIQSPDVERAPRALPNSPGTDPSNPVTNLPIQFKYDDAAAYFKMNAGTVRREQTANQGHLMGPTISTAIRSTMPLHSMARQHLSSRIGRILPVRKGIRSSTFATR